jgi:DNA topoisomerase-3
MTQARSGALSAYTVGQVVRAAGARVESKVTQPPDRYTQDTLLDDMVAAYKFAKTPQDREVLKQMSGLGTSRTRIPMIENLISRALLQTVKKGKKHELRSSDFARQVITLVPEILTDVAMTAKWEIAFGLIEEGKVDWRRVVDHNYQFVDQVVATAKQQVGHCKAVMPVAKK